MQKAQHELVMITCGISVRSSKFHNIVVTSPVFQDESSYGSFFEDGLVGFGRERCLRIIFLELLLGGPVFVPCFPLSGMKSQHISRKITFGEQEYTTL